MDQFSAGDRVEWNTSQGPTEGKVVRKLTEPTQIKGHHVSASKESPEYLVESDKSHQRAAHKPSALKKSASRGSLGKCYQYVCPGRLPCAVQLVQKPACDSVQKLHKLQNLHRIIV